MCEICGRLKCTERCPNEEEAFVYECCECGTEICQDDYYFNIAGDAYCEECVYEMRRYVM